MEMFLLLVSVHLILFIKGLIIYYVRGGGGGGREGVGFVGVLEGGYNFLRGLILGGQF